MSHDQSILLSTTLYMIKLCIDLLTCAVIDYLVLIYVICDGCILSSA